MRLDCSFATTENLTWRWQCQQGGYLYTDTAGNFAGVCAEEGAGLASGPGSEYYSDMLAIFQQLQVVDNNSDEAKGGGGVPRRPPAPPICM